MKYNIFLVRDNNTVVVSTELEKAFRVRYKSCELLQVVSNKKKSKAVATNFAKVYKAELVFPFYIPSVKHVPFALRSEQGKAAIINANKKRKGEKRTAEQRANISRGATGVKKNFSPELLEEIKKRRTKLGYRYKWIYEPLSGKTRQLRRGDPLPPGWKFGRPEITEWAIPIRVVNENRKRRSQKPAAGDETQLLQSLQNALQRSSNSPPT